MTFTILLVCGANVCRSPLAAAVLTNRLLSAGLLGQVRVTSLGVNAVAGLDPCTYVVEAARAHGVDVEAMERHRSRRLSVEAVDRADLVLTADRETRASVVRLSHSAHARSFTLRETAGLGALVLAPRPGVRSAETSAHLTTFVNELNGLRGLTELPRTERRRSPTRPWRSTKVHSHDIPDAHQGLAKLHAVTFGLTATSTEQVAAALVSWTRASAGRDAAR
jgi:protein-tyrosine phosphatase